MIKDKVRIPIKTFEKLYDNCNHGGVLYYDDDHRVGKYQIVNSWYSKPSMSFYGDLNLIIRDLKTQRHYLYKAEWEIKRTGNHFENNDEIHFWNSRCVRVKKIIKEKWKVME